MDKNCLSYQSPKKLVKKLAVMTPNSRGCTGEFSRVNAKKKFWFHVGKILRTKLSEQAEPHPIPPPTINRRNQQDHFTLNLPLQYYYRPLLGQARGFGDAVAGGFHLCMPLQSQNCEFATTGGENNIADSTKIPRRWQFFRCHQQKCPHATNEVLPLPNKDARLSLKTPRHALYLQSCGRGS